MICNSFILFGVTNFIWFKFKNKTYPQKNLSNYFPLSHLPSLEVKHCWHVHTPAGVHRWVEPVVLHHFTQMLACCSPRKSELTSSPWVRRARWGELPGELCKLLKLGPGWELMLKGDFPFVPLGCEVRRLLGASEPPWCLLITWVKLIYLEFPIHTWGALSSHIFLGQGLTMYPRLAWNSKPTLPSAGTETKVLDPRPKLLRFHMPGLATHPKH
jgi:hypothetical protein